MQDPLYTSNSTLYYYLGSAHTGTSGTIFSAAMVELDQVATFAYLLLYDLN